MKNTIRQLNKINSNLLKDIIILNNKSTDPQTINYLKTVSVKIIYNETNGGPRISDYYQCNPHIYHQLPN